MSSVIAEMFAAFSTNIRIPHIVVLIVGTSFVRSILSSNRAQKTR